MWSAYLNGMIDALLDELDQDVIWHPHPGFGRELHSQQEARDCLKEAWAAGKMMDPRAYGVEPSGPGLIVLGTLEMWGEDGRSETPVHWAFCFRGAKVALAVGVDARDQAVELLKDRCAA
jgi:hypothetical protein